MIYKILVSDRSFTPKAEIQNVAFNIRWRWDRIGGCGAFSFNLPKEFCRNSPILVGYNIKIYVKNQATNSYDLWHQGRVDDHIHEVNSNAEYIRISGDGYITELNDIYVDRDYTIQETSVIVKDVLDNDITPNTNISYTGSDVEATSFTFDSLKFNTHAQNVISTLADTVGSREWGVDENRKFYFKERSESITHRFPLVDKVKKYSINSSSKDIVNRVIVIGGDVSGSPFTATYNNIKSQAKWKRRDKAIKNTAIVTSTVAEQFADSVFSEYSGIIRRARLDLQDEQRIESSLPIGLVHVKAKSDTYGSKKYGEGQYSGAIKYQVNRISYQIDNAGNLLISMELGQLRPNVAESIGQIESKIEQLQAQGV